jgi:hypothetical protein
MTTDFSWIVHLFTNFSINCSKFKTETKTHWTKIGTQFQTSTKQTIFGNRRKSMNNQQNGRVILWLTWQKYETMYRLLSCKKIYLIINWIILNANMNLVQIHLDVIQQYLEIES